jgi:hypothetical protein
MYLSRRVGPGQAQSGLSVVAQRICHPMEEEWVPLSAIEQKRHVVDGYRCRLPGSDEDGSTIGGS